MLLSAMTDAFDRGGALMMKTIRRYQVSLVAAAALVCSIVSGAQATENGGGAYPNGAEDFMAGALPPPGTYLLNYFSWYSSDTNNDNNGNKLNIPGFKLNAVADVIRVLHVTDNKILGADWGMQIFVPFAHVSAKVPPAGIDESRGGLGDIIVDPFILGWHFNKNLHAVAGLDIYIPTGNYNKNNLANPGRNYWTFEPVAGATYLTDSGSEVSAKLMYDFNTENRDTHYRSGDEFHMDYTVGHTFGPLSVGAGGYWYQQVTDDEQNGQKIRDSKGSAVAVGPQLKYAYKNMSFTLKYLMEVETANRPEGNNLWFKAMYAF